MMTNHKHHANGFTLVELMLVILLMSSLALVATSFVDNAEQQLAFDQTKVRLDQIRRAIIGNSSQTLNGEPVLTGFVADMGRLPGSLSELVEPPVDANQLWKEVPLPDGLGTLYGGWRGPYLEATMLTQDPINEEGTPYRVFRDGWRNLGNDSVADKENYGWKYELGTAHVLVQSLGADWKADGVAEETSSVYDKDYPATGQNVVDSNDWRLNVSGHQIKVKINRSSTDQHNLKLRLFWLEIKSNEEEEGDKLKFSDIPFSTLDGLDNQEVIVAFADATYLPMGEMAVAVVCADGSNEGKLYDGGNCSSSSASKIQYFKMIPRFYHPLQLEWNTQ